MNHGCSKTVWKKRKIGCGGIFLNTQPASPQPIRQDVTCQVLQLQIDSCIIFMSQILVGKIQFNMS